MTTEEKVSLFQSTFNVRKDVFGLSYLKNSGEWTGVKIPKSLDAAVILNHLTGKSVDKNYPYPQIIGGYLLNKENKCHLGVIDIDEDNKEYIKQYLKMTNDMELPVYIEASKKKGYHLWHFFAEWIFANQARNLLMDIMQKANLPDYIEVFPKQAHINDGKQFGNYINLPLNGKFVMENRTLFLNPDNDLQPYVNQWDVIQNIETISSDYLLDISKEPNAIDKEEQEIRKTPCSELLKHNVGIGGRRPAMAKMGGYLIKRVDKDVFLSIMYNWNKQNNPPLSEKDLEIQVENLYKTYGNKDEQVSDSVNLMDFVYNHEMMSEKYREYVLKLQNKRVLFGIPDFDTVMRGLCPGELMILMGRPSSGKTALAQSMMYSVYDRQHIPSIMFSIETSAEILYERGTAMVLGRDRALIEKAYLSGQTQDITDKMGEYTNVVFSDIASLSIAQMRDVIEEMPVRPGLVVIDYLTLVKPTWGNTIYERTTNVSRDLQKLAKETNTAVICLSQVGRSNNHDECAEITLSSAINSGAIEADAFAVLGIWKSPVESRKDRIVRVLKCKRGGDGTTITMRFLNASPKLFTMEARENGGVK